MPYGNSNYPIISSTFTNALFLLYSITCSNYIDISNTLIKHFDINPYGIISWNNLLKIGIYNIIIKVRNNTLNYNTNYTLEVTTNLYEGEINILPPIISNINMITNVYQEQYNQILIAKFKGFPLQYIL